MFKIDISGVEVGVEPEPGLADSGNIQYDLPDIFELIGRAAKAVDKGWILLIDEVQYLSEADLSALIVALHRMSQEGLPVLLVGAGLRARGQPAAGVVRSCWSVRFMGVC